jgi:CheY-like chemotaxis protein
MQQKTSAHRDVLIVDDDPDVRELFSYVLQRAGAAVTVAVDGTSGLRAALDRHPDLVVTDIAMPRMDGIDMTRRLREEEPTWAVPVVAVTGQMVADEPERARQAGCSAVVAKPCSPEELVHLVNHYIGRREEDHAAVTPHPLLPPREVERRH